MKANKKLVKKTVDKHQLHSFNTAHPLQQFQQPKPHSTHPSKSSSSINHQNSILIPIQSQISPSSAINQFKKILKLSQTIKKVKSDDKFCNYKTLITNYEKQHKISSQQQQQQKLKDIIHKKYQSIPPTQHLSSYDHVVNTKNTNQKQKVTKNYCQHQSTALRNKQTRIQNDFAQKQKDLEVKYIQLKEKYKQILIVTHNQTLKYQHNKNILLTLKTQHFQDQNLLQSLRTQYLSRNFPQSLKTFQTNTKNHPQMVQSEVQTQSTHHIIQTQAQFIQQDPPQNSHHFTKNPKNQLQQIFNGKRLSTTHLKNPLLDQQKQYNNLHKINKTYQKDNKKYNTQFSWFQSQKRQQTQSKNYVKESNHLNSQNKRHSVYSQKYLKSNVFDKDVFNNLEEEQETKKSRISRKKDKKSFLSSSSLKKSYRYLRNIEEKNQNKQRFKKELKKSQQHQIQKADEQVNGRQSDNQTPRLNKYLFEGDQNKNTLQKQETVQAPIINSGIQQSSINLRGQLKPTKRNGTGLKHIITQAKQQKMSDSRLSQKSIESLRRDLFGIKKSDKFAKEKDDQKSNYLNQFRKQVKKQINNKKHEQFIKKSGQFMVRIEQPNQNELFIKKHRLMKKNEQFMSEDQYKETFGTAQKFDIDKEGVSSVNMTKSGKNMTFPNRIEPVQHLNPHDRKSGQIQQTELKWQDSSKEKRQQQKVKKKDDQQGQGSKQKIRGPQTPIYKFYQSRKPISPSSGFSKYRFKPSIKIP